MENIVEKVPSLDLSRKELYSIFDNILMASLFEIQKKASLDFGIVKYNLKKENNEYIIYVKLKNVCHAGWKDKKFIRRIQTTPLKNIPETTKNSCFLLGGIAFYENEPIFICWNANTYIHHTSNRSCYVNVSSIKKACELGVYIGCDSSQVVYLSNKNSLEKLIEEFIKDHYTEGIEF